MALEWVDVSGPPYFEDDGGWVGTTYPWQSWWMSRRFNWHHGDDGDGNYTQVIVHKVRVTVEITAISAAFSFLVQPQTGESDDITAPSIGTHTITVDLNTPGHLDYVDVGLFYYEGAVTKIEYFMEPFGSPDHRFWTNHNGQFEACPVPSGSCMEFYDFDCDQMQTRWESNATETTWRSAAPSGWSTTGGSMPVTGSIVTTSPVCSGLTGDWELRISANSLHGSSNDTGVLRAGFSTDGGANFTLVAWKFMPSGGYPSGMKSVIVPIPDPSLITGELIVTFDSDPSDEMVITCVQLSPPISPP